ncbi:lipopolysaccharide biosynthesis protein [Microbacterium aurantiacum]|uniref:lipopolysaccharide biosynthesis protein n=1 Tax=Microbacterium aurantiacum TaxID=162393 RepID=UPI003D730C94
MLAVVPVYSRTVEVYEVGIFQIATAIALIAQPLVTMRLEMITPATKSLVLAKRRTKRAYVVSATAGVGAVLAGILLRPLDLATGELLLSAGLLILAYAWIATDNAMLIRLGLLKALAWRNAVAGVLAAALQLAAALWLPSAVALAAAMLLGRGVAILITRGRGPERTEQEDDASDDADFGPARAVPAMLAGVVTAGALQSLMLTTSVIFGPLGSAQLGMAQRIAGTPTSLVGQGLSQAVAARASEIVRARSPQLNPYIKRVTLRLVAIALMVGAGLAVLGPLLAVPVLGPEWATAGTLIAVLSPPLALFLVLVPTMPVMVLIHRERMLLALNVVRLVAIVGATAIAGALTGQLVATAAVTSGVWSASYLLSLLVLMSLSRKWDVEMRKSAGE